MSAIARAYTFIDGTDAYGSQVESEFNTIFNAWNNHDSGTSKWTIVSALNASAAPLIADNSVGTNDIVQFKDNGTSVLTVADGGATAISATAGGSSVPLTVDNRTSTGSIFIAKDNGTAVFTIADGGTVSLTQPIVIPPGSISSCGLQFTSDPNTGLQSSTADEINLVAGGAARLTVQSGLLQANLDFDPDTAGTRDMGNASAYWNEINYKTLTDRGCLGWFDDGVELQDGTKVSDTEALLAIQKDSKKETVYGVPMLDYKTFPKVSYKKAEINGQELPRDGKGDPIGGVDGIEMTSIFSIMIGAIKELTNRVKVLEAQ